MKSLVIYHIESSNHLELASLIREIHKIQMDGLSWGQHTIETQKDYTFKLVVLAIILEKLVCVEEIEILIKNHAITLGIHTPLVEIYAYSRI